MPAGDEDSSRLRARLRGADVLAWVVVSDARGRISLLKLGRVPKTPAELSTHVRGPGPLRVLGIQLALPESEAFMLAHDEAEGTVALAPVGRGRRRAAPRRRPRADRLARLDALGRRRRRCRAPAARRSATPSPTPACTWSSGRGRRPTDSRCRSSSHRTSRRAAGGIGGTTVLDFQDTQIDARVVGVAKRMPSVPAELGSFVLADEGWLSTALDAGSPGEGTPREVWISGDAGRGAPAAPLLRSRRRVAGRGGAASGRRPAGARDVGRTRRGGTRRADPRRARLLGRRRQRAPRRAQRLLRPRGAGARARGHAPAAADARRDPPRPRAHGRACAGAPALAARRLAWSASRGRPACRSRRSGSIPTGSPAGSVWRR